jgi:hypothetical protein
MRYHGFARRVQDVNPGLFSRPPHRPAVVESPIVDLLGASHRAGPLPRDGMKNEKETPMPHKISPPVTVGKYLVSPIIRILDNGWYACSVSIRSGRGEQTTDRVLRLTRLFRDAVAAAEYAVAEGLQWISGARRGAAHPA